MLGALGADFVRCCTGQLPAMLLSGQREGDDGVRE
jgi:hypothetical protein